MKGRKLQIYIAHYACTSSIVAVSFSIQETEVLDWWYNCSSSLIKEKTLYYKIGIIDA